MGEEKNDYLFSTISKNKKGKLVLLPGRRNNFWCLWMEQIKKMI